MGKLETQLDILDNLIFGNSYKRIMALSQEQHDVLMDKMITECKSGFPTATKFEMRYFLWWQLSLMQGYNYQPAETQGESDIEASTYRDFWTALAHFAAMKEVAGELRRPTNCATSDSI